MSAMHEEILLFLARKEGRVQVNRIVSEFKKPPPQIEGALSFLKRELLVRIAAPGEWEITAAGQARAMKLRAIAALNAATPPTGRTAPAIAAGLDVPVEQLERALNRTEYSAPKTEPNEETAAPAAASNDEGDDMAKRKKCTKCDETKGVTAFFAGDEVCRGCRGGKTAKAKAAKAGPPPAARKANGSHIGKAIEELRGKREQLVTDHEAAVSKIDAAIETLEAVA